MGLRCLGRASIGASGARCLDESGCSDVSGPVLLERFPAVACSAGVDDSETSFPVDVKPFVLSAFADIVWGYLAGLAA